MLRNGTQIKRIRRIYTDFYFFVMPEFSIEWAYFLNKRFIRKNLSYPFNLCAVALSHSYHTYKYHESLFWSCVSYIILN